MSSWFWASKISTSRVSVPKQPKTPTVLRPAGFPPWSHHLRDCSTISGLPAVSPGLILKKATYSISRLLVSVIGYTNDTPDSCVLQRGNCIVLRPCLKSISYELPIPSRQCSIASDRSIPQNEVGRLDTENNAKRVRCALCAPNP